MKIVNFMKYSILLALAANISSFLNAWTYKVINETNETVKAELAINKIYKPEYFANITLNPGQTKEISSDSKLCLDYDGKINGKVVRVFFKGLKTQAALGCGNGTVKIKKDGNKFYFEFEL